MSFTSVLFLFSIIIFSPLIFIISCFRIYFAAKRRLSPSDSNNNNKKKTINVGILHPYSTGGGGGERVLWYIIKALHEMDPNIHIILYTVNPQPWHELKQLTRKTFNIELDREITQIKLNRVHWLNPTKFLTLFMHSIGSLVVGWEAVNAYTPHVFMDTHGCASSFLVAKWLAGCQVACYVHYPTISTDMLDKVSNRIASFNNDASIASSSWKSNLKLIYYRLFALTYGFVGMSADVVMVNSTWTQNHIRKIWWAQENNVHIVYPPVAVSHFTEAIELAPEKRKPWILSIGQFRPEKDHPLMLKLFKKYLDKYSTTTNEQQQQQQVRLVLLGGCRDEEDEKRVNNLKQMASDLNISDKVDFIVNAPFDQLTNMLRESIIGLHTMWNEHFGICVVEYMAAGLIPLAHNSGGPRMDIVVPFSKEPSSITQQTGFLAETEEQYADGMNHILSHYFSTSAAESEEMKQIQINARDSTERFSEENFVKHARNCLSKLPILRHSEENSEVKKQQ